MDSLILENVTKKYANLTVVDDLSASIPSGCVYGFIGPNGAGKTTTIRMIMNIIYPDSGNIRIFGKEYSEEIKDKIGYLPEERGLYRKMKVNDVLRFFGEIKGVPKSEIQKKIDEWLGRMELSKWAYSKVEELSKGMQQKLQFIVTVLHEPHLIVLDEPFSGLDPVNTDIITAIILELKSKGKTVLLSTHIMEQAEKICDYILLINKGKKILDGRLSDVKDMYKSNSVILEFKGEGEFISSLDCIQSIEKSNGKLEISLREGMVASEFLKLIIDRVQIERFEVKKPSLHEIFVKSVKGQTNYE